MESSHVIKRPLLTEKSTWGMEHLNQYAFVVDRRATKPDIRKAVEDLYDVTVVGVTTQVRKGKNRRLKYGWVQEKVTKKAVVTLKEGDTIELI